MKSLELTPKAGIPNRAAAEQRLQVAALTVLLGTGIFGYLLHALSYFTMIPGDLGDARFNSVVLEHVYQWVTGKTSQLWSPTYFYPFERVLGLSDGHFGSNWVYSLLRSFGLSREMAYSGWYFFAFLLNFGVCAWVLRSLNYSVFAAAAGAFTFAFALPVLHQEGHAQLAYRFAVPLACFFWYRAVLQFDSVDFAKAIFWCAVQFMCSIYLGVFLVYCLIAIALALVIAGVVRGPLRLKVAMVVNSQPDLAVRTKNRRAIFQKSWLWYVLATIAVGAVFLLLREYKSIANDYQLMRPLDDLRSLIPTPSSYLLADNSILSRWIGSGVANFPARSEHQMFIGIGVLCLVAVGAWADTFARVCVLTLLALVGLTLMVADHSLYLWLLQLPGVDAIRAVSRIILVMLFPISGLVAAGADRLLRLSASRGLWFQASLLVAIIFILSIESVYYQPHQAAVQTWVDRQRGLASLVSTALPNDTILFVTQRKAEPFYITELDAMIYAQDHQLATLNGYSGSTPPGYVYPDPCLPSAARLKAYFAYRKIPEVEQNKLLARLRVIDLEGCLQR
jgi:hypothetical protein